MMRMARWRNASRESGATLFILVQIQAGSPRFALAGYARRSHARPAEQACPAQLEQRESVDGPIPRRCGRPIPGKITVDGCFLGVTSLKNLV
jgi:hypothetical protein